MVSAGSSQVGVNKITTEVLQVVERLPKMVESVTGVDIAKVIMVVSVFTARRVQHMVYCTCMGRLCSVRLSAVWLPVCSPVTTWGPRGQGPSKNHQGPGKNIWTVGLIMLHLVSGLPYKNFGIFGIKDQMATLYSMEAGVDG